MDLLNDLNVKIYADGADINGILELAKNPLIKGFTTNPTLMRDAGVDDYPAFAEEVLKVITDHPVSFEVFADDLDEMQAQALEIASWARNVNVKIPITNTKGESTARIIKTLSDKKVCVNVTAIMTVDQVRVVCDALNPATNAIVSVFAGRIADTGSDPVSVMVDCIGLLKEHPKAELLWASPRELFNIFEADRIGCHIITVAHNILGKLNGVGKDLDQFSLETVKMFHKDAGAAGYTIPIRQH